LHVLTLFKLPAVQIDIEGSEYELLSSLHELDSTLPRQLAIEFHLQSGGDFHSLPVRDDIQLGAFLLHLANLGWVCLPCHVKCLHVFEAADMVIDKKQCRIPNT
jgi:hypothetical protein